MPAKVVYMIDLYLRSFFFVCSLITMVIGTSLVDGFIISGLLD